jgi:hypothetical protein
MMTPLLPNPIPEIYVLWHPRCELGEFLARKIHGWLRPGNGLGPQVFYRSLQGPESPMGGLPPPLPGENRFTTSTPTAASRVSNLQIVLLLADAQMIADSAWRHWLSQLAQSPASGTQRMFMPVALDSTAFNVPAALREFNFLRPAGLPLPAVLNGTDDAAAKEVATRSLLKQLTEAMCRLMLGRTDATAQPAPTIPAGTREAVGSKIKIFLSHAKADGTPPAKRIRDYIYSQTQLAAFYDENDIPFGSAFSRVLQNNLQTEETAALIAVRSARYAARPWCRRELSLFRRPVQDRSVPSQAEHWALNPTLVVDALEGGSATQGIAELGNASLIRWSDTVHDQEEQIVTTLLRDVMLAAFHSAVGKAVRDEPGRIILNWLPDPPTLLHIPRVRANEALSVLYPGRGLSGLELDILFEFFPQLTFQSFEEELS